MNADEEKNLREIACRFGGTRWQDGQPYDYWLSAVNEAYALGRRAGMTEAAGICNEKSAEAIKAQSGDPDDLSNVMLRHHASQAYSCAAAIEKARDA